MEEKATRLHPFLDADNPLISSSKTPLSEYLMNFDIESDIDISNIQYEAWVPNNSGLLRWELSAIPKPNRLLFSKRTCTQAGEKHSTIELLDYNLDLSDDIPGTSQKLRDIYRFLAQRNEENNGSLDLSSKLNFFLTNGFSLKTRDILMVDVSFIDTETMERVKIGKGHKVENAVYRGSATLFTFTKKNYDRLRLKHLKKRIDKYHQFGRNSYCNNIDAVRFETSAMISANLPLYAFTINFEVESNGRITMDPLSILHNLNAQTHVNLSRVKGMEGYIHTVQLLFGQIKNVFHGDNHHHQKDDIIMRVYPKGSKTTIVLDQIANHLKLLERIETNRDTFKCASYIPSYEYDAKGMAGYAQSFYEYFIINNQKVDIRKEGIRMKSAIDILVSSIEVQHARFIELDKKKKSEYLKGSGLRNPSVWIILIGFSTFMFTSTGKNFTAEKEGFATTYTSYIHCFFNTADTSVIISIFIFLLGFWNIGHIKKFYCRVSQLHSDYRPRDTKMVNELNPNKLSKLFKIGKFIIYFIILLASLDLTVQKIEDKNTIDFAKESYKKFSCCIESNCH